MSNFKEIIIYCILSDIGVRGNEKAESAVKSALDLTPDEYTELKPTINRFLHSKWQQRWNNKIHNKPILGEWRPTFRKSRREQGIISRLHIGHIKLTQSFILKLEQQLQCLTCQTPRTIEHILIKCRAFEVIKKRFFKVNSLIDLFKKVKMDDVLFFLRETGSYQKIWWIETS